MLLMLNAARRTPCRRRQRRTAAVQAGRRCLAPTAVSRMALASWKLSKCSSSSDANCSLARATTEGSSELWLQIGVRHLTAGW